MTTTTTTTTRNKSQRAMPVYIHSTFRNYKGEILKPFGLEWGMNGDSQMFFVPSSSAETNELVKNPKLHRGIVEAYNRWCCAKDIPFFVKEEDIASIEWADESKKTHMRVQWSPDHVNRLPNKSVAARSDEALVELLQEDEAATGTGSPAEVWINGDFVCSLDDSKATLDQVKTALENLPSAAKQKHWKRHYSDGLIRIERYYRGGIRRRPEIFDHVWDNLVALEDPEIVDDQTMIGTATLSDWIMGGNLTSRLWIRDDGDSILFLRPLRNDEVGSSDRRYELVAGSDPKTDQKMAMVREELERLRYLAKLRHPYEVAPGDSIVDPHMSRMEQVRASLQRNKKKGKFFGV